MAYLRTSIPSNLVEDVMYSSDHTCCVCRERGKTVQIHHVDENPSNIVFGNLSVLCTDCHAKTQIKSAFGDKISADTVIAKRDEWLDLLDLRKKVAIEMAVTQSVNKAGLSKQVEQCLLQPLQLSLLEKTAAHYINTLPAFKKALLNQAQPNWDRGEEAVMLQQSYDYIDALKGILMVLARYCSPKRFETKKPQEYFSELISSRFKWHKITIDPLVSDSENQLLDIMCGTRVMADVEMMIENMVMGIAVTDSEFNADSWSVAWNTTKA